MLKRWREATSDIPEQDKVDLVTVQFNQRMQLCPEYSDEVYQHMRRTEFALAPNHASLTGYPCS